MRSLPLGVCPNRHDEGMKAQYESKSPEERAKYPYEADWLRYLTSLVESCDRIAEKNRRKLAEQKNYVVRCLDLEPVNTSPFHTLTFIWIMCIIC